MRNYTFILLFIGLLIQAVNAQPVFLKEIPKNSRSFISAYGKAYFFSSDSLYVSDGTPAGTKFVKKLGENPSTRQSYQNVEMEGSIIFRTSNSSGYSLWRSDGTATNTIKLGSFKNIEIMFLYNSTLYLTIDDGIHGKELWKMTTDYSFTMIKDILPGEETGHPKNLTFYKNKFYFLYNDMMYLTDGTEAGTKIAADFNKGSLDNLVEVNGFLYLHAQNDYEVEDGYAIIDEILKSDGTLPGTSVAKRFESIDFYTNNLHDFISYKNQLYFFNHFDDYTDQLWTSDGTPEGTTIVEDHVVGDGEISDVFIMNDKLVFYGENQGYVYHLWVSDGTSAGTRADIMVTSYYLEDVQPLGNFLFYGDHDGPSFFSGNADNPGDSFQLFQSDLSEINTKSVRKIFGGGDYSGAKRIISIGDKIIFSTYNDAIYPSDTVKARLWVYDPLKPADNVSYLTVVDTDSDKDIQWLKSKDTINKKPGMNISIRYHPVGPTGSVVFKLEDQIRRTESVAPYALAGDYSGDYSPWQESTPGNHKVTAVQYSEEGGKGTVLSSISSEIFIYKEIINNPPEITINTEQIVTLPQDSIQLNASITDPEGEHISWYWDFVSGPSYPQQTDKGAYSIILKELIEGDYSYLLTAYDSENSTSILINIHVQKEPEGMRIALVNAVTDTDIRDLLAQDTIVYNSSTDQITIRAIPEETVGSVQLFLDGALHHNENAAPYALQGDVNGDYTPWAATYGTHSLTVKSFTGSSGKGTLIESKTIQFVVRKTEDNPPPPPPTNAQITFTLVNAVTDQDIGPLIDGQTINLSDLPTNKLNVRANSSLAGTKSVVFGFNGNSHYRTEGAAPYALFGDSNGDYFEWNSAAGTHHLKATPYTGSGGSGTAGVPLEITFYIIDGTQTQSVSMKTYPNPVEERLSVSVEDLSSENVSILIHDENGGMIYTGEEKVENGKGNYDINLNHLKMKPGLYFVRIRSDHTGEEKVTKIIKR